MRRTAVHARLPRMAKGTALRARSSAPPSHPALDRLREAAVHAYGNRLKRAVLFGSRARGDARCESDWDVALFLDPFDERDRHTLDGLRHALLRERGEDIAVVVFPASAYADATLLMEDIRAEGVDLIPNRMSPSLSEAWDRRLREWTGPMKEITADELKRSREALALANQLSLIGPSMASVAAREAYLAVFHAALALIHEKLGRSVKTHNGVQALLHRLAAEPGGIGTEHAAFLTKAYALKQLHDHSVDTRFDPAELPEVLDNAKALVDAVAKALGSLQA